MKVPLTCSVRWLRLHSACTYEVRLFWQTFGTGTVKATRAALLRADEAGLDVEWWWIATKPALLLREEFDRKEERLWEDYYAAARKLSQYSLDTYASLWKKYRQQKALLIWSLVKKAARAR